MTDHDVIQELLGAYSLDAVEPDEVVEVEGHLATCARCRQELAGYREVTSLLAHTGGEAPAGIWDRIAAGMHEQPADRSLDRIGAELLAEVRSPGRRADGPEGADGRRDGPGPSDLPGAAGGGSDTDRPGAGGVSSLDSARRRRGLLRNSSGRRWQAGIAGLAAAAVAAAAVLGAEVANLDGRLSHATQVAAVAPATMSDVRAALSVPGHRSTVLRGPGSASLDVVILPSGVGYVYAPHMRRLPSGRTYQLWGVVGSEAISYGLLGPDPRVEEFRAGSGVQALAVTDEVGTGVVVTHQRFSVSGTVPPAV